MTFLEDLLNDLPELVGRMRHHDVRHVSLKNGTGALALTLSENAGQTPPAHPVAPPAKAENTPVPSPEMGVFRSNGLGENHPVRSGEIVGFVEAGPLRLPVTATADGTLGPALIGDGCVVGYHDVLFRIHPDG
ncbi:hypothetical protein [Gluconobacter albidus]|uniref:Lipoyl-binding domain-containing protein n=1 Tax=Gluconobacter albidus TaxID=318683 RepID=A0AAW3QTQ5_9PROT|nr:hypothetical protein [Gluconobacter albidus]KXV37010.1 hypothetical protein AD941_13215 [Gluconobacter albidus]MBS1027092.1 hypothetical protein [Gluconobacter albidus]GBQ82953.1 hypothetical protein AA3250_0143 [Gluconobacter albidus NBRC 3250]GLQ69875.1 hypothetical protein GCM10007866_23280 [Gluconobacter albidus]